MKNVLIIIILAISTTTSYAQSFRDQFNSISKNQSLDTAISFLDSLQNEFEKNNRIDSLVMLYTLQAFADYRKGDFSDLEIKFIKAQTLGSENLEADHISNLYYRDVHASILLDIGDLEKARELYEYNINLLEDDPENIYLNKAIVGLATYYGYISNFTKCKKLILGILPQLEEKNNDQFTLLKCYNLISFIYNYENKADSAFLYIEKNLNLVKELFGVHPNTGMIYEQLASYHKSKDNYDEYFKLQNEAINIYQQDYDKNKNPKYISLGISNLGHTYAELGEYEVAIDFIKYGEKLLLQKYDKLNIALLWTYSTLGDLYYKVNNLQLAKHYNNLSSRILKDKPDSDYFHQKAIISINNAEIALELNHIDSSIEESLKILEIFEKNDVIDRAYLSAMNLLSLSYFDKKDYNKALEVAKREYEIAKKTEKGDFILLALINILDALNKLDNTTEFDSINQMVLKDWNNGSGKFDIINLKPSRYSLAYIISQVNYHVDNAKIRNKSWDGYLTLLDSVEKYLEILLMQISNTDYLSRLTEILYDIYKPAIEYYSEHNPDSLLLTIEKFKNYQAKFLLKSKLLDNEHQTKIDEQFKKIQQSIIDQDLQTDFYDVNQSLELFRKHKDSLYHNDQSKYLKLFGIDQISLSSITDNLYEHEALLEYLVQDSALYIVTVINSIVNSSKVDFSNIKEKILSLNKEYSQDIASELYQLLIPESIRDSERICIIPDHILYYLNFEILLDQNDEYLIKNHTIRYAHSSSILKVQNQLHNLNKSNAQLVAFTPGFDQEFKEYINSDSIHNDTSWNYFIKQPFLLNLAEELNNYPQSESYQDSLATEDRFKSISEVYNVIHFGTHGIIDDRAPLFSKLILTKNSKEDGYLHTYEIFNQDIDAQLAVLASCSSGAGVLKNGEGIQSLAQAFTKSGCPSILLTLYDVDEQTTSMLLKSFYDNLRKGQTKSEALRNAKLSYLETVPAELQKPFYWSGLIITGSDLPVYPSTFKTYWLYFIAIFILLILLIIFINRRRNLR